MFVAQNIFKVFLIQELENRNMDLPATHYGKLDNRNPVVSVFERDVKTFQMLMRRVTCASSQDNSSYAKG